ncbi:MAG: hypothetical protein R6V11_01470 [Ectothiorhodospiraceae bacterium]
MRIIALVTDPASIQAILAHIGEPARPPTPAPGRDPPAWGSDFDGGEVVDPEAKPAPPFSTSASFGENPRMALTAAACRA